MNLPFVDISYAQGNYDMAANKDELIAIKMSGFYTGSHIGYYDSEAAINYKNAIKAGKGVVLYHYAGGANPTTEAEYFVSAVSPLTPGDVYALDFEVTVKNPSAWVQEFVDVVHQKTGVWPWVYMDISVSNTYDFSGVFKTCGFWCAAPSYPFEAKLPVKYPVLAQQGPIENGVDTDMFYGTLEEFKAYGYKKPAPAPVPPPAVIAPTPTKVMDVAAPVIAPPPVATSPPMSPPVVLPPPAPNELRRPNWFAAFLRDLVRGI